MSLTALQQPRAQFEQFAARPKPPAAAAPAPAPVAASDKPAPKAVKAGASTGKTAKADAKAEPVAAK